VTGGWYPAAAAARRLGCTARYLQAQVVGGAWALRRDALRRRYKARDVDRLRVARGLDEEGRHT
jgi:hypothetical protein